MLLRYMSLVAGAGALGWFFTSAMLSVTWGFGGVWAGSIFGLAVGLAQTRVLERCIPSHDWSRWTLFSVAGGTIAWLVFMTLIAIPPIILHITAISDPEFWHLFPIVALLIAGAIFGLAQWLLLRRTFQGTVSWLLANTFGWALGGAIGISIASVIYDNIIPSNWKGSILIGPGEGLFMLLSGVTGTIVFSAVTGVAFLGLSQSISGTRDLR